MRFRSLGFLSVTAIAALALAGCASNDGDAEASPSATTVSLCDSAAPEGDAVEAVTVDGEVGQASEATFTAPLEVSEMQRKVIAEGDGDPIEDGEWVNIALTAYDATTGEEAGSLGYNAGEQLPTQASSDNLGAYIGCASPGSRVVVAAPATTSSDGTTVNPLVYIIDVLSVNPTAAWGEAQDPQDGFPTVTLADDGTPTVTILDGETAPETTEVEVLKKGDGITVEDGDTVFVQYTGVQLSDGSVFDSSWESGSPISFSTDGVITGFQTALVGQTVGSQVVAVIPAAEAYGAEASDSDTTGLAGEDLVFVVDILATVHATSE